MRDLDIGEVAQRACVPASTLRYYEQKGLIASTGRRGLRRLFGAGVVERLALIALGRAAGFSLDEIDKKVRELTAMRDGLRHAVACKAPSHMECPTFRRLLSAASQGALIKRRARRARY